jgi:hypothetical protein
MKNSFIDVFFSRLSQENEGSGACNTQSRQILSEVLSENLKGRDLLETGRR